MGSGIEDCEINPFNILVDKTGMIKVALFGLSQLGAVGALLEDVIVVEDVAMDPDTCNLPGCR